MWVSLSGRATFSKLSSSICRRNAEVWSSGLDRASSTTDLLDLEDFTKFGIKNVFAFVKKKEESLVLSS